MDLHVKSILKRLTRLGYRPFEIKLMIREAIGVDNLNNANAIQYRKVFRNLEKYEHLGSTYKKAYSK